MERAAIEKDVSDEALMSDLASGQQDAIGLLYARYAPTILGMAAQALGRPTAEDIVQDVFLAVWKNAPTYDSKRGPVRPWLLQIAHYRIANELRRRSRRPQIQAEPLAVRLGNLFQGGPAVTASAVGSAGRGAGGDRDPRPLRFALPFRPHGARARRARADHAHIERLRGAAADSAGRAGDTYAWRLSAPSGLADRRLHALDLPARACRPRLPRLGAPRRGLGPVRRRAPRCLRPCAPDCRAPGACFAPRPAGSHPRARDRRHGTQRPNRDRLAPRIAAMLSPVSVSSIMRDRFHGDPSQAYALMLLRRRGATLEVDEGGARPS